MAAMAVSSPRPVDQRDLYDGPDPNVITPQFPAGPDPLAPKFAFAPEQPTDKRARPDYVATVTAALDIIGARLLALIAVVAACAMWSWTVYDPTQIRIYAAAGFSVSVLMPTVLLYFRKG
jgi:hypothetical protein